MASAATRFARQGVRELQNTNSSRSSAACILQFADSRMPAERPAAAAAYSSFVSSYLRIFGLTVGTFQRDSEQC
jgi:hypothetical protein